MTYQSTKEELFSKLSSSEQGLSEGEASKSRERYGLNELAEGKQKNVLQILLDQFKDFLVIILIGAAVVSAVLGDMESTLVIVAVITLNAVLGTVQHLKAEKSLSSLKAMSSPSAKVLRKGKIKIVPSKEVYPGDVVFLEAGDYVCADGRIVNSANLKVNESALTGESLPVEKQDCVIKEEAALGDRVNMVYSGSFVTYGRGSFLVTATGMNTEVGKIAELLKSTSAHKTPLQENLDDFGKKLSVIILVICSILFTMSVFKGESIISAFMFAVALAVAAIPEALSSIVTIVLAFGTQKMAKEHAIIRKLQAVEGLGGVSVICSDKTGTLTQNKMTVMNIYAGAGNKTMDQVDYKNGLEKKLVNYSVLCSDATSENGIEVGDPTEIALVNVFTALGMKENQASKLRNKNPRFNEIPFDSDRKLMSTVHEFGGDKVMITKGAVDVLLDRTVSIEDSKGIRDFKEEDRKRLLKINREYSEKGLRVLAFGYKYLDNFCVDTKDENKYIFLGLIAMMDPPRKESREAVKQCIQAGIRPIMITGDHKITASAIAREIGILQEGYEAVEGSELDKLSDQELKSYVERVSVYARVSPEHKIRIVRAWQEKGNVVAMTGDGVNDAPALKQADVGVAMGITGTEVAKDAASMVLTDDNFSTIVKAVENGRNVYKNVKKSIKFLLSGNTAGILAVLYASLAGLPVPFAAVHLLFINLLTDSLPAIALGLDPHSGDIMKEAPRKKGEAILTKDFLMDVLVEGAVMAVTTMVAYHAGLAKGGASLASTMAFSTLCLSRLVHGFNSKSDKAVLFTKEFNNNKYIWGAFAIGFMLLNGVLLIPQLQSLFQITEVSGKILFSIYGLSLSNLFIIQGIKWLRNKCHAGFRNSEVILDK